MDKALIIYRRRWFSWLPEGFSAWTLPLVDQSLGGLLVQRLAQQGLQELRILSDTPLPPGPYDLRLMDPRRPLPLVLADHSLFWRHSRCLVWPAAALPGANHNPAADIPEEVCPRLLKTSGLEAYEGPFRPLHTPTHWYLAALEELEARLGPAGTWIAPNLRPPRKTDIGPRCVLGPEVRLAPGLHLERCVVQGPARFTRDLSIRDRLILGPSIYTPGQDERGPLYDPSLIR